MFCFFFYFSIVPYSATIIRSNVMALRLPSIWLCRANWKVCIAFLQNYALKVEHSTNSSTEAFSCLFSHQFYNQNSCWAKRVHCTLLQWAMKLNSRGLDALTCIPEHARANSRIVENTEYGKRHCGRVSSVKSERSIQQRFSKWWGPFSSQNGRAAEVH